MEEEYQEGPTGTDFIEEIQVKTNPLRSVILVYEEHIEQRSYSNKVLGTAYPIDENLFFNLAKTINEKKIKTEKKVVKFLGHLPKNLHYFNFTNVSEHFIMFTVSKGPRNIKFIKSLEKHNGDYYFPEMVFILENKGLSILLKKDDKFYYPDFPNMSGDTALCMGSVKMKFPDEIHYEKLLSAIESLFFDTYFSHETTPYFKHIKNKKSISWPKKKMKETEKYITQLTQTFSTIKKK